MRHIFPLALMLALPGSVLAQARPDTSQMTCASARALVVRSGAIVLSTGRFTYDRYVSHRGFCTLGETTEPAFVPSRDNPACHIGELCIERRNEPEN